MRISRLLGTALVASAVVAVSLTGCSSGGSSGGTTLSYAIWDKVQQPAMEKVIAAFEKKNPDIKVDVQVTPYDSYFTKLQTALTGGSGPDVFWMNGPNFQLYASNGQLAPLTGVPTSKYSKALVDLYSYKGTLYGAPKDFDTIGVWYNKTLFQKAGLSAPTSGWTWDDYLADAKALTDTSAGVYGSAAALAGQENYYDTIAQAGGDVINSAGTKSGYGSEAALKGVDFWVDQIKDGVSPTLQQMTDTAPQDMFTSGKVAMFWSGSWSAAAFDAMPDFKDQVGVAPLPAGSAGNQSVIHGLGNVANAKSSHLDAAKKFAVFASGQEAADIMASTGSVIPAYSGTQTAWVDSMKEFPLSTFIDATKTAVPYPVSANTAAWNSIETDELTQVWSLQVDPATGLKQLASKMQAVLDKK